VYQQTEVNKLKKQLNATEEIIYQVYQDNEDYYLDVLSETDAYQSYLETL
jgi:ssDNA-specific exonuclease RecJ